MAAHLSPAECPVPIEQQPLHEYEGLRFSWFGCWAALPWPKYLSIMVWVWGASWLVTGPIAAASFEPRRLPLQFFLSGAAGSSVVLLLILLRLYYGWIYVGNRLSQATVAYEESGWYDGQSWTKPEAILGRDRLIVTYQLRPVLRRLQFTLGCLSALLLGGGILWRLLMVS